MLLAVIAHRDLDGLVSAAVIISSRVSSNPEAKYWLGFAQPHELPRVLAEVAALSPPPDELFIVDVAADSSTWYETRSSLERLVSAGIKVTWVDHHPSTLRRVEELGRLGVVTVVEEAGSAATLVRRLLPQTRDPEFFEKLVRVAEAFDNAEALEEPLASALEVLADALALEPTDDTFRRQVVAVWLRNRVLVPEDAVMRSEEAAKVFEDLLRRAQSSVVLETERVRVIDLRPVRVRGFAGKLLSRQVAEAGKVVAVVFRLGSHSAVITARAPPSWNVNLDRLFERLAAKYGGSGGGHARAASLRVPLAYADRVVEELRAALER